MSKSALSPKPPCGDQRVRALQEAASARGNKTVTNSAYGSMAYSRGASALEAAVALGEIDGKAGDQCILRDFELFSSVASTSAGIELMHNVAIVLGNSASSASPFEIGHAVMRDAIDSAAVIDALKSVGKSAALLRPEMIEAFGKRIRYFNTFGGNPASCAVAHAVLKVIKAGRQHQRAVRCIVDHAFRRKHCTWPVAKKF